MCYEQAEQLWCNQGSHYMSKPSAKGIRPCSQVQRDRDRKLGDCWAGILPCAAPQRLGSNITCKRCWKRMTARDEPYRPAPPEKKRGYVFEESDSNSERDKKTKKIKRRQKQEAKGTGKKSDNTGYNFEDSDSERLFQKDPSSGSGQSEV